MRADRLLQIMLQLQSGGGFTTRELAERLEVSERTIHRDMEALCTAGVPVYAERGAKGGWRLTEGYRMDWAALRKDELLSILASKPQRHLADLGLGDAYEAAVRKVLVSLSPSLRRDADYMRQRVHVDAVGWHPGGEELPWLPIVQEAVWEGQRLRLIYASSSDSAARERFVNPLGLVLKGALWYLVATREDHELRSYRVSRILDAILMDEPVVRPDNFDLAAYWNRSVDRFRSGLPRCSARAHVHPGICARLEQTRYVRVLAWRDAKEAGDDSGDPFMAEGWREADLEFNTLESARDILLGFGSKIRVLEPQELSKSLQETAKNIVVMYNSVEN